MYIINIYILHNPLIIYIMTVFSCSLCSFSSNLIGDYKRHIKTNKHLKNLKAHQTYNKTSVSSFNLNLPHSTSIDLNLPQYDNNIHNNSNNDNIVCKYCNKDISDKNKKRHYMTACLEIPDKMKNRLIEKHNSNLKTINKLEPVPSNNNKYNIINNNNINNNNITNTNLNVNPLGQESLDHISTERMEAIIKSNTNLMKMFYESLIENVDNSNSYIDNRNNIAFYTDDKKNVKIERLRKFLNRFCELCMNRIRDYLQLHPDDYSDIAKKIFMDTYNIFVCMINRNNIQYSDDIEKEHKALVSGYEEDVKLCMMKNNKEGKARLNILENDFNKLT